MGKVRLGVNVGVERTGHLLSQNDQVSFLLLDQLGDDLGHSQRLQMFVLLPIHRHVNGSVSPHGEGCAERLLMGVWPNTLS